ncbi:hypothetical protein PRIPAC_82958 [Pristionchus pacificus]|uniref:Lipase n=1 Tax=Pristionchus pacificus TaxID=54126 RepID=A0A2A6CKH5_PRIPA|nr:hypothetical protein PRIPAC_82958 [Pristionchus pacificus]|eukprot:PDM78588.1 lipase [Pristionchus pacificus]
MLLPFVLTAILASVGADYDDSLARNIMFPLASAAYGLGDTIQQCLDKHLPGTKLSFRAEVRCDSTYKDTCSGYTFIDDKSTRIGLVFKGTDKILQLSEETHSLLQDPAVPFKDGGMVGPYFNTCFLQLWNKSGLGADVQRLSAAHPDYTLYITGHSLGASMSALAVVRIAKNKIHPVDKIINYNFGEPRTGDKQFASLFDSLLKGYRVIHDKDLIPHTPFPSMGYQHHATEVFYENNMTPGSPFVVCKEQEDPKCSNKHKFDLNFADDHFHYFNLDVVASQVLSCFAVVICAGVAAVSWLYNESIYLPIYQSFLLGAEIIACILVFIACCTTLPALMYPIIIIQIWNSFSILAIAIWSLINWIELVTNYGTLYYTCFFPVSLVFSLCVLYCHFCCYKLLLLFEKHFQETTSLRTAHHYLAELGHNQQYCNLDVEAHPHVECHKRFRKNDSKIGRKRSGVSAKSITENKQYESTLVSDYYFATTAHVASNCDNHSCLVSSISLSFSVMVYQSKMFTHTICCCSATVASQVMAIIAIILCAIVAVTNWFYDYSIYFSIYQTILLVTEIIACILVFVAVCKILPAFVLPIIIIQISFEFFMRIPLISVSRVHCQKNRFINCHGSLLQILNSLSIVVLAIWQLIDLWSLLTGLGIVYLICIYAISLLISLFVLHCHVCCFKLLLFTRACHDHHSGDHYNA